MWARLARRKALCSPQGGLPALKGGDLQGCWRGSLSGSAVIALEVIAVNERFGLDVRENFFLRGW